MPVIKKQQTPIDFTAQYAGSVEGLFETAMSNGISITDQPNPGSEMKIEVIEKQTTAFYAGSELDITGAFSRSAYVRLGGIGYMQIGNDFIVS